MNPTSESQRCEHWAIDAVFFVIGGFPLAPRLQVLVLWQVAVAGEELIAGQTAYICDECIELGVEVLSEDTSPPANTRSAATPNRRTKHGRRLDA